MDICECCMTTKRCYIHFAHFKSEVGHLHSNYLDSCVSRHWNTATAFVKLMQNMALKGSTVEQ